MPKQSTMRKLPVGRANALLCLVLLTTLGQGDAWGSPKVDFQPLSERYQREIQPLLKQFCLECHSAEAKEGELDLEVFSSFAAVRTQPPVWQRVAEMLGTGEMPPKESPQLTSGQMKSLQDWVKTYLDSEALAQAGDPGPVVLRRLNNAEYTYTIRDLTQTSVDPTREFPVDGAAGEGFTNTGNSLSMSPAMVQKYLDASKQIAEHAVLLPDGIRFAETTTRRDWSNELVNKIRGIYAYHTTGNSDVSSLDTWNGTDPTKVIENDGRVDLNLYFARMLQNRDRLKNKEANIAAIASDPTRLSRKYLHLLSETLLHGQTNSPLLRDLQRRLEHAGPDGAAGLTAAVRAWQDQLWKFNTVGHLGLVQPWQQAVNPTPEVAQLRFPLAKRNEHGDAVVYLVAGDAGDGNNGDLLIWNRPRIEYPDRPPVLLKDVRPLTDRVTRLMASELSRTPDYLAAVLELRGSEKSPEALAKERGLNPRLLDSWAEHLNMDGRALRRLAHHMKDPLRDVHGHREINGWSHAGMPSLLTNSAAETIQFLTLTIPPRSVVVHPSPTTEVAIGWKSPIEGQIRVRGKFADADDKCGNGAAWKLENISRSGFVTLATGTIDNGQTNVFQSEPVNVRQGDVIVLVVNPRDRDHSCDTSHVELTIDRLEGDEVKQTWDLAKDVVDNILQSNPAADSFGNAEVWHFHTRAIDDVSKPAITPGSSLALWREAALAGTPAEKLAPHVDAVVNVLTTNQLEGLSDPDRELRTRVLSWNGPLAWVQASETIESVTDPKPSTVYGLDPALFGTAPADAVSLVTAAPSALEIVLPAGLAEGGQLVVDAFLDLGVGRDGTAQALVLDHKPGDDFLFAGQPILTRSEGQSRQHLVTAYDDFRKLFPAAMCHARVVPVDEVVTLLLYHREDEHLANLMMEAEEIKQLDRLWEELHYVSQDALRIEVALEQILEFATQDADPKRFDPVRQPIADNAVTYRRWLEETEPAHVDAVLAFAHRAFRRPLTEAEKAGLNNFYKTARRQELPHEDAIRLTLTRVLTAPAFLYRLETPGPEETPTAVSDFELASRLSYFLWSSAPDEELLKLASEGKLNDPDVLKAQCKRMLSDDRAKRLAVEFACQWLHIRDFDQSAEKSETLFPEFVALREDMYQESVRFFADLFQNNGSILEVFDADHTFLNERLAKHYGIPNVTGENWRRVEKTKEFARGGILSQATVLASQSGASRTSPILRGNWVSETLLGERLPRPPKGVPLLPETQPAGLSERQLIEKHSSDAACVKCHQRIDPMGFALESFDAVGRFRQKDAFGHPIDTTTQLMDGTKIDGLNGLKEYLLTTRRDTIVRQFCKKLLGYALGRAVQLSDEPLLGEMMGRLKQENHHFSVAVESIVCSDQFRNIRGLKQWELTQSPDQEKE